MDEKLREDNFIKNENGTPENPFLFGLFFIAVAIVIVSGLLSWINEKKTDSKKSPFYQVTNREFSEFIRQNPKFHHQNVSSKEAYLPGLKYIENIASQPEIADNFVKAPDYTLFQYHTWKRLIDLPHFKREIPLDQFKEFLTAYPEWTAKYWKSAPKNYIDLIQSIEHGQTPKNLEEILPDDVQKAFIGWKNFTSEKDEMEQYSPTFELLQKFLKEYPNFSRNYWINILKDSDPAYLETASFGKPDPTSTIPDKELAPFLDIALFNYSKTQIPPEKQVP